MNKNKLITLGLVVFFICVLSFLLNIFINPVLGNSVLDLGIINLTSKVEGKIEEVNLSNNQEVKKGEILLQIDSIKYKKDLENLQKELSILEKELSDSNSDVKKMSSISKMQKNNINIAKDNLEKANDDYIRYKNAYQDGSVTKNDLEKASENLIVAKQQYEEIQNELLQNSDVLKDISRINDEKNKEYSELCKKTKLAELDLSNTTIISPINGVVKEVGFQKDKEVKIGDKIANIYPFEIFVNSELNEGQINKIKIGQKVYFNHYFKQFMGSVVEINENKIKSSFILEKDVSKYSFRQNSKVRLKIKY